MCLNLFAYRSHPEYKFILAANRDEFYARSSSPAAFWQAHPQVLGGIDLQQGGTWLGITGNGRFSMLTNYRDRRNIIADAPSRGHLVKNFLAGSESPGTYISAIEYPERYNGFNLIAADSREMVCYSNKNNLFQKLNPGIYCMSNAFLDTPWFKLLRGKTLF